MFVSIVWALLEKFWRISLYATDTYVQYWKLTSLHGLLDVKFRQIVENLDPSNSVMSKIVLREWCAHRVVCPVVDEVGPEEDDHGQLVQQVHQGRPLTYEDYHKTLLNRL